MTNKAITGANQGVELDKLRTLYFGGEQKQGQTVTGIKVQNKPSIEAQLSNKKSEKNYYGWELKHIEGMEEAIELRNRILEQEVVIVVYKEKNETGLIPHLDVEFKTANTHLDIMQMGQLIEVIKEAKKLLCN